MRRLSGDAVERLERRLAVPVLAAALASVPATFLTMLEGDAARLGHAVNWLSLVVLGAESTVPLLLTQDRARWLRGHWPVLAIALLAVPAVVLALGPVQLLRVLRFAGALRILRVARILRAGRVLAGRLGPDHPWARGVTAAVTVVGALFAALVLADPTSTSRRAVDSVLSRFGPLPALAAGALLGAATFVLARRRRGARVRPPDGTPEPGSEPRRDRPRRPAPAPTRGGAEQWD